jgi:hypothetical protein
MAKLFVVTIPVAGHAVIEVEADDKEAAIKMAMSAATEKNIDSWEFLEQFNKGNVCYCPSPWRVEAESVDGEDEE